LYFSFFSLPDFTLLPPSIHYFFFFFSGNRFKKLRTNVKSIGTEKLNTFFPGLFKGKNRQQNRFFYIPPYSTITVLQFLSNKDTASIF